MNLFFLIFFTILGIVGIIFRSDAGVFVGLGLVPWQVIRMGIGAKYNLLAIILTALAGSAYFIYLQDWVFLFLFLFIELYNYWGHLRTFADKE